MSRNWTYLDDDAETLSPAEEQRVNALMKEWNRIERDIDHLYFTLDSDYDNYADFLSSLADEEGEEAAEKYKRQIEIRDEQLHLRQQEIEQLLASYGTRVMRPYEHWNEEEKYYEYMENRYENDDY